MNGQRIIGILGTQLLKVTLKIKFYLVGNIECGHQSLNLFCFIVEQIVCLWAAGVAGYVKLQRPQSCFGFAISFNDYNLLLSNILFTFAIQIDGRIGSEAPERLHIARFNSFANLLRGLIAPILAQQEKGGEIPCSICTLIPLFYYCFKCCHILSVNFRLIFTPYLWTL